MIAICQSFGRAFLVLTFALAVLVGFGADVQAEPRDVCLSSTQTEAYAENVPFNDGTLRAHVSACLHARDFDMLDVGPYESLIRIHVNGVQYCPQGGYGYDKYYSDTETDDNGAPVLIYVEASFGFDINRPDLMDMNEHGALLATDRIRMSWDKTGTTALEAGCPIPEHGPNSRIIDVENRVGGPGIQNPPQDLPTVTITPGTSPVTEGTAATFTLNRTGATTSTLTVSVGVTETGNMILGAAPQSVTFTNGAAQATLTVPTQNDTTDENDSVITMRVTAGSAYSVGNPASTTVTVRDDDVDLPMVTITPGTSPVPEGTAATFTLRRTGATMNVLDVMVDVRESGIMINGTPPTTVRFNAGSAQATLMVPTLNDITDESDSVITARVTTGSPYQLGSPSSATVTVQDDDMPTVTITPGTSPVPEGTAATFTLSRRGAITESLNVTMDVEESGSMINGTPPTTVRFNAGAAQATLTVPTQLDTIDESDSVITATVKSAPGATYAIGMPDFATVTVQDDDAAPSLPTVTITPGTSPVTEGTAATFTLNRTGATTSTLTVSVGVTETGNMIFGTAPQSVTFTNGAAQATLTVPTQNDTTDENDSVITMRVTAGSAYSVGNPASTTVTVRDDDVPQVTLTPGTSPVPEGTAATFILNRTGTGAARLTVSLSVSETESMISGAKPTTATFEPNSLQATLNVATEADAVDEPDSVITATLTTGSTYSIGNPSTASVTVRDDDVPGLPVVTITRGPSPVNEGTDVTFTLNRTGTTVASLSVTLNVSENEDMISGEVPSDAVFEVNATQIQITIQTEADAVDEPDSVITATVIADVGASYSVGAPSSGSVTVRDDDGTTGSNWNNRGPGGADSQEKLPAVEILAGPSPVTEGTAATFTLRRAGATEAGLTVAVEVSETGTMIGGTKPVEATFGAGMTLALLSVPTLADKTDERDSVITARIVTGAAYTVDTSSSATVTVLDDDEWSQSQVSVNDELLPRVTQAMLSSTLSAISSRLDMSVSGVDSKGALQLGKEDSLEQILASLPVAADGSSLDLKRMLVGKSILLPLNASGNGLGDTVLWGRGDYRDLRGGNDRPLEWDGDLVNIHLGADMWLLPDLLAGVAVSWSEGDFDYRQRLGFEKGDYVSKLTSVHPYVSWSSPENAVHTWATAGYGWGEVEIDDGSTRHSSDTRLKTGAVGISSRLATAHDLLMPGTSTLRFKGEGNISQIKADGSESINPLTADIQRLRMAFEGKHLSERGEGKLFIPSVEVGLRIDRGEGLTGTGLEIGTAVDYTDTIQGLTLKGQARMLIDHADDYDEWSIQGEVRMDPGPGQLGLSLSLIPSWGALTSTMDRLWAPDANTVSPARERPMTGRLDAKFDYGLSALGGRGLLTPYAHFLLAGEGGSDFRFGSRLEVGPSFSLGVEGSRLEDGVGSSDHKIGFWSEIQF